MEEYKSQLSLLRRKKLSQFLAFNFTLNFSVSWVWFMMESWSGNKNFHQLIFNNIFLLVKLKKIIAIVIFYINFEELYTKKLCSFKWNLSFIILIRKQFIKFMTMRCNASLFSLKISHTWRSPKVTILVLHSEKKESRKQRIKPVLMHFTVKNCNVENANVNVT